jgi:sugar phosphate permease
MAPNLFWRHMARWFVSSFSKSLHAWVIWLLAAIFLFYKYAIEVSPNVMAGDLMRTFSLNGAQLGNLAACYFYAYTIMQLPVGILIDRFGPRRVTTIAIAVCALGSFMFGSAGSLLGAGTGRFLIGIGAAFAAINCLKLTSIWFPAHRFALMAGLMMTLGMLGAAGGQTPLSAFISHLGWRDAMFHIAVAGVVLAILFWFIVKDRASPLSDAMHRITRRDLFTSCKKILSNPQTWLLSLYSGVAFAPVAIFGGLWGSSYLKQAYQITSLQAAHLVSLIFIGFAVGAPLAGWFSDYIRNRRRVMFWGTLFAFISMCFILYVPGLSMTALSTLLFMFGVAISCFLVCFTMICEINPPFAAGTAIGFMNTFDAFLGALSDPLTGKFLDMGWKGEVVNGERIFSLIDYRIALSMLPLYLGIGLILLYFIKETHCRHMHLEDAVK